MKFSLTSFVSQLFTRIKTLCKVSLLAFCAFNIGNAWSLTVDQQNLVSSTADGTWIDALPTFELGQTFTPSQAGIDAIEFSLQAYSVPTNAIVKIRDLSGGLNFTGNVLGVSEATIVPTGGFQTVRFDFPHTIELAPGVEVIVEILFDQNVSIELSVADPYAGGETYYQSGGGVGDLVFTTLIELPADQEVVDQKNLNGGALFQTPAGFLFGQTFTPAQAGIDAMVFRLRASVVPSNVSVRLRELPVGPILGGNILGSSNTMPVPTGLAQPIRFDFASTVPLIPGTEVVAELLFDQTVEWEFGGDLYPDGASIVNGAPFGDADLVFTTLVDLTPPSDIDGDGVPDVIDPCPADPLDECDDEYSSAELISDSEGGTLATTDDELVLDVQPGELGGDVVLSATKIIDEQELANVVISSASAAPLAMYVLGPEDTVFNPSITLTMSVDVTSLSPAERSGIDIYLQDEVTGEFVAQMATCSITEDPPGTFIALCDKELFHFSTYLLAAPVDTDGDGILDDFAGEMDACPMTAPASVIKPDGCSIADLVPCDGDWRNGFEYILATFFTAKEFLWQGLITPEDFHDVVWGSVFSGCGV